MDITIHGEPDGQIVASELYWFFVRREINDFRVTTPDGVVIEGTVEDNHRVVTITAPNAQEGTAT